MNSNMYFSANTVQNVDLKRQEHKYESETGKEQKQRIGRARQEHMQAWICDKKGTETQKCKHQVRRQARLEHGIASMISKENQNKNIENFSKKGTETWDCRGIQKQRHRIFSKKEQKHGTVEEYRNRGIESLVRRNRNMELQRNIETEAQNLQ